MCAKTQALRHRPEFITKCETFSAKLNTFQPQLPHLQNGYNNNNNNSNNSSNNNTCSTGLL
jgi:hypothetical protein